MNQTPAINGSTEITFEKRRSEIDDDLRVSNVFAQSGFFPDAREVARAAVLVMAGRELGFKPFASMTGISIIKGKPSVGAHLMASRIVQCGYDYRVKRHDAELCTIEFYRGEDLLGTSTFTWKEAQTAGLAGKDNWKNYPKNMLWARAMANGARWYCAGAFGGAPVYTPDELGAEVTDTGDVKSEAITKPTAAAVDLTAEILNGDKNAQGGTHQAVTEDDLPNFDSLSDEEQERRRNAARPVQATLNK